MARSEARIFTDIWDDVDFLSLSPGAQRLYLFLVSQSDLAHDGVIALRERRWSRTAAGLSTQTTAAELAELSAARFVVLDEDTEELLIRSFMRRDGVYRQPNLLVAARRHLPLVASRTIRSAIADELRRMLSLADVTDRCKTIAQAMLADLSEPVGNPSDYPSPNPNGNATRGTLGARGMVTAVSNGSPSPPAASQQPPAHHANPSPIPTTARKVVLDALADDGCTADEADAVAERVQRDRRPRQLVAVLRTIAAAGELPALLADVRTAANAVAVRAAVAAARDGPECEHGVPGGASAHPTTNEPLCPHCRVAARGAA